MLRFFVLFSYVVCATAMINLSNIECGIKNGTRIARIVGGRDAMPAQFPWLVSITRQGGHFCGGTIISNQWVVTAAHCICTGAGTMLQPKSIKVTLGQHDLRKPASRSLSFDDAYEMDVSQIYIHPGYTCQRVANDIAMLRLSGEAVWSHHVRPACLSPTQILLEGANAVVAGWGWTSERGSRSIGGESESEVPELLLNQVRLARKATVPNGPLLQSLIRDQAPQKSADFGSTLKQSESFNLRALIPKGRQEQGGRADVLQSVDVNIIQNEVCQSWYKSQGKKTKVTESQLCAGSEQGGKDSCWADSGGPLMVETEGRTVVVGVVSTGIGCARPKLPGLYTRVSHFLPWIQETMAS